MINAGDGRWDLPTLMLQAQSKIQFFNEDSRKMFKIEVWNRMHTTTLL